MQPSLLFTDTLRDKIEYLVDTLQVKQFIMYVHPFVDAYLKKGFVSEYRRWWFKYGRSFRIEADQSLALLQYRVVDHNRNEIDLKEEKDTSSATTKKERRSRSQKDID